MVQSPNQRLCDRNGLPRLQEKPPVKVRHTNYGLIQLLLPAQLRSCSAPREWADWWYNPERSAHLALSIIYHLRSFFICVKPCLKNMIVVRQSVELSAFSFQPIPPPPTNRLVAVLPSLPLAVNNMTICQVWTIWRYEQYDDMSSWYCSVIFVKSYYLSGNHYLSNVLCISQSADTADLFFRLTVAPTAVVTGSLSMSFVRWATF